MDLFVPIRFRTAIQLTPTELHANFEDELEKKLKSALEGVCSRFGYIRNGSIEIMKRSAGQFVKQHFNGHIRFELVCRAEVCNPPQGAIFKAVVRNKNAMGMLAESSISIQGKDVPVLDVIIPKRAAGIASDVDLEEVQIGDEIYISVQGKRYQLRDKKISVIGKAVPKTEKEKSVPMPTEIVETEIEELRDEVYEDSDAETDNLSEGGGSNASDEELPDMPLLTQTTKAIDIADVDDDALVGVEEVVEEDFEDPEEFEEEDEDPDHELGGAYDDE